MRCITLRAAAASAATASSERQRLAFLTLAIVCVGVHQGPVQGVGDVALARHGGMAQVDNVAASQYLEIMEGE